MEVGLKFDVRAEIAFQRVVLPFVYKYWFSDIFYCSLFLKYFSILKINFEFQLCK